MDYKNMYDIRVRDHEASICIDNIAYLYVCYRMKS